MDTKNLPQAPEGLKPLDVANYFIQKSQGISHLKIQKLVYCAQGWWLAYAKAGQVQGKLFEELPQAWAYGPVYNSLYAILSTSRHHSVPVRMFPYDETEELSENGKFGDVSKFLDWVYARYKDISGVGLSALTHKEGTPWHQITEGGTNTHSSKEIPESLIENEFSILLQRLVHSG